MSKNTPTTRLDEFDKNEWFDIVRKLKPKLTEEQYSKDWVEFQTMKAERKKLQRLN